ncbi:deoxynucleoside triphosphate triphosphohydrolase SAMHD1-like protein [Iris pallida]|uniref:Deoxynucleoside triphosphate triphosphohydrolase SAMHD1-like protein n=1 Tax=Iris pallida TaxID=29817 RepID=A0AAX6DV84_IRIPA|nr:deoxynucleoside triphosphate triphosphohydrolase SAMHD1-like protein [Iris pallida]
MGSYLQNDVSMSQEPRPPFSLDGTEDRRHLKQVYDNVHGTIKLDPLSLKFIDTVQFQRLRDLKQLGLACMVYPGAVHSRFEHSLGVYWLAGQTVRCLQTDQTELDIDRFDIQTVKLAGLMHDVGHGPFSHLFEHEFLPRVLPGSKWCHEQMSIQLVDYIVDENHIDIDSVSLRKVKDMIITSSDTAESESREEKRFLYDIVANGRNGIDVDKFDYISRDSRACGLGCNFQFRRLMESMRVMDNEICYPAKEYLTIFKLFATRADLHRTVYTHAKVKAIELMLVDALVKANDHLAISSYIFDPAQYWKLDDTIIKRIETSDDVQLKESRDLISRIRRRDLYQFCNEYSVPNDKMDHFKNITAKDIICSQKSNGVTLKEEDVAVSNIRIDLTRGKYNPLERINFFQDYESQEKFPIPDFRISNLLPSSFQDRIVRVYAKKPELVNEVSVAFENMQLKMYGVKAQVHDTPEKKKRKKEH